MAIAYAELEVLQELLVVHDVQSVKDIEITL
jgi:hypothetical protein